MSEALSPNRAATAADTHGFTPAMSSTASGTAKSRTRSAVYQIQVGTDFTMTV
jgi:hypothetical protein